MCDASRSPAAGGEDRDPAALPRLGAAMFAMKTEAIDLVTEADEQAERMIKAEAARLWPERCSSARNWSRPTRRCSASSQGADLAIVVDPIDGTFNFASGIPAFGVMASVVSKGETVAGIIYDPMGDDWVMAEKGGGAWLRAAGW